jgi:hypothetical protein
VVDAPPGEAARIDVLVVEDPDHMVGGPLGVDGLDGLKDIAGVPTAADQHQGQNCHVTVPA